MFDIKELMAALGKSSANVTINIYQNSEPVVEEKVENTAEIDTEFNVGDRVMVCHTKKDGSGTKHTVGTVDSIGADDFGPYVRVTGDNGKHYKCGIVMNEARKGSKIFSYVD
jgi:hypothetical protein